MPIDHDSLVPKLMEKHGITLPRNAAEWRGVVTEENEHPRGELRGLYGAYRLILTDGVVAYALNGKDQPFFCHLANFFPEEKERAERVIGTRPKLTAKQKLIAQAAMED